MFEEKVEKPRTRSLSPLRYKDVLLKEFSRAVQENYTKNAQILREHREYIKYLEQELEKSRDSECQANNQASYEYILKCEAEKLLEEKQEQIVALKSQLDSQQSNLPEVPQFVAEFIKKYKGNWSLFGAFKNISDNEDDNETLYSWVFAHARRQEIFAQAWLNGYTVAKEKRFYLKNKLTDLYLAIDKSTGKYVEIEEKWLEKRRVTSYKPIFPQQEIDSMETGSYEQMPVEVEE